MLPTAVALPRPVTLSPGCLTPCTHPSNNACPSINFTFLHEWALFGMNWRIRWRAWPPLAPVWNLRRTVLGPLSWAHGSATAALAPRGPYNAPGNQSIHRRRWSSPTTAVHAGPSGCPGSEQGSAWAAKRCSAKNGFFGSGGQCTLSDIPCALGCRSTASTVAACCIGHVGTPHGPRGAVCARTASLRGRP